MRVVVTGAGGFVGRELVGALLVRGDTVVGVDCQAEMIPSGAEAVAGDLGQSEVRSSALAGGCDVLVHLATVPGGAAELDPAESRRINVDAMYDLLLEASRVGQRPRVIYASSIAVFGDPMPALVDDDTPLSPRMIYGGHKAMMEHAIAMFSNRGSIDGITVRLPGILARPKGPSGMKSAFLSDLFHALKSHETFICPVSPDATIWAQSVDRCARNFVHALDVDSGLLPATRAVTLPALRVRLGDLVSEVARQCQCPETVVTYQPDPALEAAFGRQPALKTPAAERAGFANDTNIVTLVTNALAKI